MKNNKIIYAVIGSVLGLFLLLALASVFSNNKYQESPNEYLENNLSLSNDEINGLIHMREEEKLARDVYSVLYDKWNVQVFSNITGSEEVHTSEVKYLLDKYAIPDPVIDDSVGVFQDPDMQELYNKLTEKGLTSLVDALQVGVTIEELDIKDLDLEIAKTQNPEIISVYQNLKKGSQNHLRAFNSNLEKK